MKDKQDKEAMIKEAIEGVKYFLQFPIGLPMETLVADIAPHGLKGEVRKRLKAERAAYYEKKALENAAYCE
jgi:hypothetical protein